MSPTARILDANFNRAREALRVMEDAARFALNDAALCEQLKAMRHELREIIETMYPPGMLEANRDTPGDVGTAIATAPEMTRGSLLEVVIAAGKRLTESLRVIEEISKISDQRSEVRDLMSEGGGETADAAAPLIELLRYRAYEIDKQLQLRFGSGRSRQWTMCLVLTKSFCKRPWQQVVSEAIAGGADCVQVREKDMNAAELVRHVREVIAIAKPPATADLRQVAVIVNDRVDIALTAGADGVHLGQNDLSVQDVRRMAGRILIVGASAHDLDEARVAVTSGADYCGVGTMFASTIKPELTITGPAFLKAFIKEFPNTPHLAIGGVTPANVHLIGQAGGRGVAVSSAVCAADSPRDVVSRMINAIHASVSDASN